jgi:hypothetical protein
VHLRPCHHFEEDLTAILFDYEPFFTAGDLSSEPSPSFPPPPNTSPPPDRYDEPPAIFYHKSESPWVRLGSRLLVLRHLFAGRPESTGEPSAPMGNSFPLFRLPMGA